MKRIMTRIMAISASPPSTAPTMRPILIFDPEEEFEGEFEGESVDVEPDSDVAVAPGKLTVTVSGIPPIVVVCTAPFAVVVAFAFGFFLG
jgi:hypothetical protein